MCAGGAGRDTEARWDAPSWSWMYTPLRSRYERKGCASAWACVQRRCPLACEASTLSTSLCDQQLHTLTTWCPLAGLEPRVHRVGGGGGGQRPRPDCGRGPVWLGGWPERAAVPPHVPCKRHRRPRQRATQVCSRPDPRVLCPTAMMSPYYLHLPVVDLGDCHGSADTGRRSRPARTLCCC
jgi:hypothetical protein